MQIHIIQGLLCIQDSSSISHFFQGQELLPLKPALAAQKQSCGMHEAVGSDQGNSPTHNMIQPLAGIPPLENMLESQNQAQIKFDRTRLKLVQIA